MTEDLEFKSIGDIEFAAQQEEDEWWANFDEDAKKPMNKLSRGDGGEGGPNNDEIKENGGCGGPKKPILGPCL